jgi:PAS domain S-box-containing protein
MDLATDETRTLRRCVRDLVALSSLSAYWERTDPPGIAEGLAEALLRSLNVDFIYARLKGSTERSGWETARTHQGWVPACRAREVGQALDGLPRGEPFDPPPIIPNPFGEGEVRLAIVPLGYDGDCGFVVAGSRASNFPSETDRLLLGVAANQAAVVLQHKQAEAALNAERELLRVTLASIGDAVISTDTQERITFLNGVAQTLTGWTRQKAEGVPLERVFHIVNEQTRQPVANPALRALREGQVVGLANHTVLIAKDGREYSIDDSAAPIRGEDGQVRGVVLVFRDVTERRRLEMQNAGRLTAARLLASIVESSDDAIVSKTLDGIIQSWNTAAEQIFGYSAEQAVGRHISLIIPAERANEEDEIIARIRAGERIEHFDTVRVRSDGQHIPISLTISPIRDEMGRIVGASKIARSITERKQAEERIYSLVAELKQTDRRKDEFLATLAHELRNPLAPLRNALQIMKLSGNDQAAENVRAMMERQLSQMVRLVDDLLDVSRISQGKIELHKERLTVAAVVESALEISRPLIETAHHELTVALPPQPLLMDGDLTRLAQVLSNLLNNAAKYTPEGGHIWLTVEASGERQPPDTVAIRVRDNGAGIPPDMLPRVFELFTQVDRTLERAQGGLGIGLTLVRQLVEMHGGTVEASSEGLGRGSTFTVRLPLRKEELGRVKEETHRSDSSLNLLNSSLKVLVADDNVDSARSLALLLELTGNEVRIAHDGPSALEAAAAFVPDVILLDIGMPGMSGLEVARRLRAMPPLRDAILVAQTGWGQEEDRRRSEEAGFNVHLVKPVDPVSLQGLLAALPKPGGKCPRS